MKNRPNDGLGLSPEGSHRGRLRRYLACMVLTVAVGDASADDLAGTRNLLCTVLDTHVCIEASGCVTVLAEDLNIPRFIRVDTKTGILSTTPASDENRETKAESVKRENGQIVLQGVEEGRAFSLFIHEPDGFSTFASAADGRSVTAFGVCTPSSSK